MRATRVFIVATTAVALATLPACGGVEGEDVVDAPADTHAGGDAPVCKPSVCTPDPDRPPVACCTEACIGAPCEGLQPPCDLPCSDAGFQGRIYCTDGTWQAGLGLFPCGEKDAGVDADADEDGDAPTCSIGDAFVADAACSAMDGGCGAGEICAIEIGGPMKRGATWCVTIPPECGSTPTCACMGVCACGRWRCVDGPAGEIYCDDGTI